MEPLGHGSGRLRAGRGGSRGWGRLAWPGLATPRRVASSALVLGSHHGGLRRQPCRRKSPTTRKKCIATFTTRWTNEEGNAFKLGGGSAYSGESTPRRRAGGQHEESEENSKESVKGPRTSSRPGGVGATQSGRGSAGQGRVSTASTADRGAGQGWSAWRFVTYRPTVHGPVRLGPGGRPRHDLRARAVVDGTRKGGHVRRDGRDERGGGCDCGTGRTSDRERSTVEGWGGNGGVKGERTGAKLHLSFRPELTDGKWAMVSTPEMLETKRCKGQGRRKRGADFQGTDDERV